MDPVLSSLMPTHQVGSDGFNWWIGQIESEKNKDPKKSGRYRVRIIGHHLKEGTLTPSDQLPWAQSMMPVTTPYSDGGVTGASVNLNIGNWVMGFFMDSDKQKPIIMGSIGHTAGATTVKNEDPAPTQTEKEFTTYVSNEVRQQTHDSVEEPGSVDKKTGAYKGGGLPAAAKDLTVPPAIIKALRSKNSELNSVGSKVCVTVANPKCGTEGNFKKGVTKIIQELLANQSASGGQLGSFYVSKVNGFLYSKVNIARYHIGRVVRLVKSLMGRAQSEMIRNIRQGIEWIVKAVLGLNVPEEKAKALPKPADKDHKPVKKEGNILKRVKKIMDKVLESLGCAMEDAIDRLVKWLTDLLFNYIMEVISPAACLVTNMVDGILNQIISVIDTLINTILGPIQNILSIIGGGINVVSGALGKVMSFLGITCSGPNGKCDDKTVTCNDCGTDEEDDDLDKLLADIEAGDTGERFVCDDAKTWEDLPSTNIVFVGGVPEWESIGDYTSTPTGSENPNYETPETFFPSTADDPSIVLPDLDDQDDTTVTHPTEDDPLIDDENEDDPWIDDDEELDVPLDPAGDPYYAVSADPDYVRNGDTITYEIITSNVPFGTTLRYHLSGVDESAIADGKLYNTFTVQEHSTVTDETIDDDGNFTEVTIPVGKTIVTVKLSDTAETNEEQELQFDVQTIDDSTEPDTYTDVAYAYVTVAADLLSFLFPEDQYSDVEIPSYVVTTDKKEYREGEDIIYTITTTNVEDNTKFEYLLYGDISADDFIQDVNGTFTVVDNTAKVTIGIVDDLVDEFDENVYFTIVGQDAQAEVKIIGTLVQETTDDDDEPKIDKPTADDPITDETGGIISIPIKDTGDKYSEPPAVIITGAGYGATGIALLDESGYVSEIRVTRTGVGYKRNIPKDNNISCIIDSFTIISPGMRYTSPPTVYVNNQALVAEAEVDEQGFVFSVKILDRTIKYDKTPIVKLIGGGGAGAIVLPSMVCLEEEDLANRGAVKIGTGKYIDCP